MRLTAEQRRKALAEHGCYVTEACDRCGKLLGCVRYTRCGEPGECCSEICRDGFKAERRRGGRPRLKLSAKARVSRWRKQVRDAVERHRLGVIKNCQQPDETEGLADAFSRSGYHPTRKAISPIPEARR